MKPVRPRREPSLAAKTVLVTVVAFATLVVLGVICWLVVIGAHAAAHGQLITADEPRPNVTWKIEDHRPGAKAAAGITSGSEDRAAMTRMRILIADVQRQQGDEPSGTVRTTRSLHAIEAKISTDSERAALLQCIDTAAIRRELVDQHLTPTETP